MSSQPEDKEQGEVLPSERLEDAPQEDSDTPGAQKPDSEVLNEKGMNTE
jgi:hypothetical protein